MKTFEALSMLMDARDGVVHQKNHAVRKYGEKAKSALKEIGMLEKDINGEYPDETLEHGLFLVCNHPVEFAKQAKASAAWLISRN